MGFAVLIGLWLIAASAGAVVVTFTTPVVMGFPAGDDWEPVVASDGLGNVYVLITHLSGVPGFADAHLGSRADYM